MLLEHGASAVRPNNNGETPQGFNRIYGSGAIFHLFQNNEIANSEIADIAITPSLVLEHESV